MLTTTSEATPDTLLFWCNSIHLTIFHSTQSENEIETLLDDWPAIKDFFLLTSHPFLGCNGSANLFQLVPVWENISKSSLISLFSLLTGHRKLSSDHRHHWMGRNSHPEDVGAMGVEPSVHTTLPGCLGAIPGWSLMLPPPFGDGLYSRTCSALWFGVLDTAWSYDNLVFSEVRTLSL